MEMAIRTAENFTRSTVAPIIRQDEIAQNAPWKITKVSSESEPDNELKSIPDKNALAVPPKKLPKKPSVLPNAIE